MEERVEDAGRAAGTMVKASVVAVAIRPSSTAQGVSRKRSAAAASLRG